MDEPTTQQKLTVSEFATKMKAKYPAYKDMPDEELADKIIAKFPIYANQVEVKKKVGTEPNSSTSETASSPVETISKPWGNVQKYPDQFPQPKPEPPAEKVKRNESYDEFMQSPKELAEYDKATGEDTETNIRFPHPYYLNGQQVTREKLREELFNPEFVQQLQTGVVSIDIPEDPETEKLIQRQFESGTRLGDKWDYLMSGFSEAAAGVVGMEHYVKDIIRETTGIDVPKDFNEIASEFISEELSKKSEEYLKKTREYEQGFVESLSKGDIVGAVDQGFNTVAQSAPITIAAGVSGAALGTPAALGTMAGIVSSKEYSASDQYEGLTRAEKLVRSTVMGTAEAAGEVLVSGKILTKNFSLFKNGLRAQVRNASEVAGKEAAEQLARGLAEKQAVEMFKEYGIDILKEGGSEGITQLIQMGTDDLMGLKDYTLQDYLNQGIEATALGMFMGGIMGAPTAAVGTKRFVDEKLKREGPDKFKETIGATVTDKSAADAMIENLNSRNEAVQATPDEFVENTTIVDAVEEKQELVDERDELLGEKEKIDDALHPVVDEKINVVEEQIKELDEVIKEEVAKPKAEPEAEKPAEEVKPDVVVEEQEEEVVEETPEPKAVKPTKADIDRLVKEGKLSVDEGEWIGDYMEDAEANAINEGYYDKAVKLLEGEKDNVPDEKPEVEVEEVVEETPEEKPKEPKEVVPAEGFAKIPISELTTDLESFQGREDAYSGQTYNRIVNEAKEGTLNISAIPPIQIWKNPKTDKWVILGGHSRTASFTDLSAGKHELNEKFKAEDFSSINAQIVQAESLDEAKKIAQESNQGAQQTDTENAKYIRGFREKWTGTQGELDKKLSDLYGSNKAKLVKLSFLNPSGKTIAGIKTFEGQESESSGELKKYAAWIGESRRRNPQLTDAHEDEMYTFLMGMDRKKPEITDEATFVQRVGGLAGMGFDPNKPLNISRIKYKTLGETEYERQMAEIDSKITEREDKIEDFTERFNNPKHPDYIKPTSAGYDKSVEDAEVIKQKAKDELKALRKEKLELMQKKGQMITGGLGQRGMFDELLELEQGADIKNVIDKLDTAALIAADEQKSVGKRFVTMFNAVLELSRKDSTIKPTADLVNQVLKHLGLLDYKSSRVTTRNQLPGFNTNDLSTLDVTIINAITDRIRAFNLPVQIKQLFIVGANSVTSKTKWTELNAVIEFEGNMSGAELTNTIGEYSVVIPDSEGKAAFVNLEAFKVGERSEEEVQAYQQVSAEFNSVPPVENKVEQKEEVKPNLEQPKPEKKVQEEDERIKQLQQIKADLKKKIGDRLKNINAGIDPEVIRLLLEYGLVLLEEGVYKFDAWATKMMEDLADELRAFTKEEQLDIMRKVRKAKMSSAQASQFGLQLRLTLEEFAATKAVENNDVTPVIEVITPEVVEVIEQKEGEPAAIVPTVFVPERKNVSLRELFTNVEELKGGKKRLDYNEQAIRILEDIKSGAKKDLSLTDKQALALYSGRGGMGEGSSAAQYEFYTPPEVIQGIYEMLGNAGLMNGIKNMLEPAIANGHFIGLLPDTQIEKINDGEINVTGVDLPTSIAVEIAKVLYPKVSFITHYQDDLRQQTVPGLEALRKFKERPTYDFIVTNVPFDSSTQMNDLPLHDGFLVELIEKHLQEGGILTAITSSYTSDNKTDGARQLMLRGTDILAVLRLPAGAFQEMAGTNVSTDIIVFRKRTLQDTIFRDVLTKLTQPQRAQILGSDWESDAYTDVTIEKVIETKSLITELKNSAAKSGKTLKETLIGIKAHLQLDSNNKEWLEVSEDNYELDETFVRSALVYMRNLPERIENEGLKERYVRNLRQVEDALAKEWITLSATARQAFIETVNELIDARVTETFDREDVINASPLYSLLDITGSLNNHREFGIIVSALKNKKAVYGKVNVNDFLKSDSWRLIHTRWGAQVVNDKMPEFNVVGNIIYKKFNTLPKPTDQSVVFDLNVRGRTFFPGDSNPAGSVVQTQNGFFRKERIAPDILTRIAIETLEEQFGKAIAEKASTFNDSYTLEGLFQEALRHNKQIMAARQRQDFNNLYTARLVKIGEQVLTGTGSTVKAHWSHDKLLAEFVGVMKGIIDLSARSLYVDLNPKLTADNKLETFKKKLNEVDGIIKTLNVANSGASTDEVRENLKDKIKTYLREHGVSSFTADEDLNKYLGGQEGNKSDLRFYILRALDNIITDAEGKALPVNQWKGLFIETVNFSTVKEVESPGEFLGVVNSTKPEFSRSINVSSLFDYYIRNQNDRQKLPPVNTSLHQMLINRDLKEFVNQVTAEGVFMVDYDRTEGGELHLIAIDDYARGNINEKINTVKQFQGKSNDGDIAFHNIETALESLSQIKSKIPDVPLTVIDFNPHMNIISFKDHTLPFFEAKFNLKLAASAYKFNGITRRYEFTIDGDKVNIPGLTLPRSTMAVTQQMMVRWFNGETEERPKRDQFGNIVMRETPKGEMVPEYEDDVDTTVERNKYLQEAYNQFIKESLPEEQRKRIHDNYNSSFMIYTGEEDVVETDIGLPDVFRGKPFKPHDWQWRATNKFFKQPSQYNNHNVGSGKTITAVMSFMKAKKTGIANKAIFTFPLKTRYQWLDTIGGIYPEARVKLIQSEDARAEIADAALGNYDIIAVTAPVFANYMFLSVDKQLQYVREDLKPYTDLYNALEGELNTAQNGGDKQKAKEIERELREVGKKITRYHEIIENIQSRRMTSDVTMSLDRLGVDFLVVDEAHEYKNLATIMSSEAAKIKGVSQASSDRAMTMYHATKYIQEINKGNGTIYLSGTPVANSATEIYNAINAINPRILKSANINTFDDFISNFGNIEAVEMVNQSNEIVSKPTFTGIRNINQLKRIINNTFDVVSAEEMQKFLMEHGHAYPRANYVNVTFKPSPERTMMTYYQLFLADKVKELAKLKPADKKLRQTQKDKLEFLLRQKKTAFKKVKKTSGSESQINKLKAEIENLTLHVQALAFNSIVLYTRIKSGVVHSRLFNKFLDESLRDNSKVKIVAKKAAEKFRFTSDAERVKIDGLEFYDLGVDDNGKNKYHSVTGGQLFFMDAFQRSDLPGFNAMMEYINAIKEELGNVPGLDNMFLIIPAGSQSYSKDELMKILQKYYENDSERNDVFSAIWKLGEVEEEVAVTEMDEATGKEVLVYDDDGNIKTEMRVKAGSAPTKKDVAQYLFNAGKIRFMFGSTPAMGVGMDLQKSAVAVHHIDLPPRPLDFIQRNGRSLRQGNWNYGIDIYTYASEGGPEVIIQQLLRMKENFISKLYDLKHLDDFSNEENITELATGDVDEASILLKQFDNMIANTQDVRIKEFVEQRRYLDKLKNKVNTYRAVIDTDAENRSRIAQYEKMIEKENEFVNYFNEKVLPLLKASSDLQQGYEDDYKRKAKEYDVKSVQIGQKYEELLAQPENAGEQKQKELLAQRNQELDDIKPKRRLVDEIPPERIWEWIRPFQSFGTTMMQIARFTYNPAETDRGWLDFGFTNRPALAGNKKKLMWTEFMDGMDYNAAKGYYTMQDFYHHVKYEVRRYERTVASNVDYIQRAQNVLASEGYKQTLAEAQQKLNGTPENPKTVYDEIAEQDMLVKQNEPVYFEFVQRQNTLAKYANRIISNVLPGIESLPARMKEIDEFVKTKEGFERGDLDLPTFEAEKDNLTPVDEEFATTGSSTAGSNVGAAMSYASTGKEISADGNISLAEVSKNLAANLGWKLGTTIRAGFRGARLVKGKSIGLYFQNNGVVRLRGKLQDFFTLSHEVGHGIDMGIMEISKTLTDNANAGLVQFEAMIDELIASDAVRIATSGGYSNITRDGKLKEAIAEYISKFIIEPQRAVSEAPNFTAYFMRLLDLEDFKTIKIALLTARNDYNRYVSQDAVSKVMSEIQFKEQSPRQQAINQLLDNPSEFLHKLYQHGQLTFLDDKYTWNNIINSFMPEVKKRWTATDVEYFKQRQADMEFFIDRLHGISGIAEVMLKHKGPYHIQFNKNVPMGPGNMPQIIFRNDVKPLTDILSDVVMSGKYNEFVAYVKAKRVGEYLQRGLLREHGKPASSGSPEVKKYLDVVTQFETDPTYASFVTAIDELRKFNDAMLEYLADTGSFTEDEVTAMKFHNQFWIPWYGSEDPDAEKFVNRQEAGSIGATNPIKYVKPLDITQGQVDIMDPIEGMTGSVFRMVKAAEENRAVWGLVNMLHELGSSVPGEGQWIQRIPSKEIKANWKDGEQFFRLEHEDPSKKGMYAIRVKNRDAFNTQGMFAVGDGIKQLEQDPNNPLPYPTQLPDVFEKVEYTYYQIPEYIYEGLTFNKDMDNMRQKVRGVPVVYSVLKGAYVFGKILKDGAINLNASFTFITNPFRDLAGNAWLGKGYYTPVDHAKAGAWMINELITTKGLSEAHILAMAAGADMSASMYEQPSLEERIKRAQTKQTIGQKLARGTNIMMNPFSDEFFMRRLSQLTEEMTRQQHFTKRLRETGDLRDAVWHYRNASRDYAEQGGLVRMIGVLYPFLPAGINHTKAIPKLFKDAALDFKTNGVNGKLFRKFAITAAGFVAFDLLLWALNNFYPWGDDDEKKKRRLQYQEQQAWLKYGFYRIPFGDGISLPRVPLTTLVTAPIIFVLDKMMLENPQEASDLAETIIESMLPRKLHPFEGIPHGARPLFEIVPKTGYNTFRQEQIIPDWVASKEPHKQYTHNTRAIYVWLAEKLHERGVETYPWKMQHLVESYTAGAGKFYQDALSYALVDKIQPEDSELSFPEAASRIIIPNVFTDKYSHLGPRSYSAKEYYNFVKQMDEKKKTYNELSRELMNSVMPDDYAKNEKRLQAWMEREKQFTQYYLNNLNESTDNYSKLKTYSELLHVGSQVMYELKASDDEQERKSGEAMEVVMTELYHDVLEQIRQGKDIQDNGGLNTINDIFAPYEDNSRFQTIVK